MTFQGSGTAPSAATRSLAWSRISAAIVIAIATLVLLIGWGAGSEFLVRLRPAYAAMVPTTALSFIAGGIAVLWPRPKALRAGAVFITAISVANLALMVLGRASGIDSLYLHPSAYHGESSMAPATALCFLLVAMCLVRLPAPTTPDRVLTVSATAGLLLALVAVIGYAFDSKALYAVSIFTAMALHTAISFVALFTAVLLSRPELGWVATLLGPQSGSVGARRVFPIAVLTPFLLCLLALYFTNAGMLDANFRLSLLAIAIIALLATAVLRNASLENSAERNMVETMRELREALDDRDLLLREVHHRVRNNLQLINALISIESENIGDPECRSSFRSMASRIHALGAVHEQLVSASRLSKVGTAEFIRKICERASTDFSAEHRGVAVEVEAVDRTLEIESAMTLGLLVNELVINALTRDRPRIRVVAVRYQGRHEGGTRLIVAEDGQSADGSGDEFLPPGEIVTRIVLGLAGQLGGRVSSDGDRGVGVVVDFPAPSAKSVEAAG